MAKGDDIQERMIGLAAAVVTFCGTLPKGTAGSHISTQLLRCGTSPAPNYAEARGAESDRDFIHKLKVVLKELNECLVWLAIIQEAQLLPNGRAEQIREECTVLCRITAASIKTVKARLGSEKQHPGFRQG